MIKPNEPQTVLSAIADSKLEKIGFTAVPGMHEIDNSRLERIARYLEAVAVVASNPTIKAATLKVIDEQIDLIQQRDLTDLYEIMNLIRRIIANFTNEPALKLALEYASSDRSQDLIAREGQGLGIYLKDERLLDAALSALELAKEKYAQEHGGRAYQTSEQLEALAEAKTRSAKAKIQ